MPLSGAQHKEIQDALIAAFGDEDNLRQMLRLHMGINLESVAKPGNMAQRTYEVVEWAGKQGRVADLIEAACAQNPNNPELLAVAEAIKGWHIRTAEPAEAAPYKGLAFYGVADAALFYGREALTAELVTYLKDHRFLAVVGASGSGKSSVVRAGVVPSLLRGEVIKDSDKWAVHVLTPTARPLQALAAELTKDSQSVTGQATLMHGMAKDPRSLDLFAAQLAAKSGSPRVLLIVDQFEELFTLCKDRAEQQPYIDNLLAAAVPEGVTTVILTLRADFYARCAEFANLRVALSQHQNYIGPMSQDELRTAIEKPAALNGWDFEPGLVEVLLDDVEGEAGSLPLLSHALLETWARRSGRTMTFAGYHAAGGVQGAIAQTADAVYAELPPQQQAIARNIFLRLTTLGEGTQDTRRRVLLSELLGSGVQAAQVQAVLSRLADDRLVTVERASTATADAMDEPDAMYVDVTHETLIREWPRLATWLHEDREGLLIHRRLTEAAQEWEDLQRDQGALFRGARLAQAAGWAQTHADELNDQEREFLHVSQAQLTAEQRERERIDREREEARQRELDQALELVATAEARIRAEEERAIEALARQRAEQLRAEEAEAREQAEVERAREAEARRVAEVARAAEAEKRRGVEEERARQAEQSSNELAKSADRLRRRAWYLRVALVLTFFAALATGFYYLEAQRSADEANLQRLLAEARISQFGKVVGNLGFERLLAAADDLRNGGDNEGPILLLQTALELDPGLLRGALALQLSKEQIELVTAATGYVYVPAGEFKMGSDPKSDSNARSDEKPPNTITLRGFWIMRTEVTNGQYARCVLALACTPPKNQFWEDSSHSERPVTDVNWHQASEYAQWAGGRLPTEAEWEKACRGTDGRIYPWGNKSPVTNLANPGSDSRRLMPVGSHPDEASPYGALDMAGSVLEWTASLYEPYPYNPTGGQDDPNASGGRTLRGGASFYSVYGARCASRVKLGPSGTGDLIGFRIVSPSN